MCPRPPASLRRFAARGCLRSPAPGLLSVSLSLLAAAFVSLPATDASAQGATGATPTKKAVAPGAKKGGKAGPKNPGKKGKGATPAADPATTVAPTTTPETTPTATTDPTAPGPTAAADTTTPTEATPAPEPTSTESIDPDKPSGWLFDGDVGIPKLKSNESSLAFDVNAGYLGRHWGVGFYASLYNYALQSDARLSQTSRSRYGIDLRYLSGSYADDVRYEGKLEMNTGSFSTSTINTDINAAAGDTGIELSGISRITALVGRRARVSDTTQYKLQLGAGSQFDTYARSGTGGAELSLSTSFRLLARGQARYALLPEKLHLRGEGEVSTFEIRRIGTFAGGDSSQQAGADPTKVITFRENDVKLRLFADLKLLSFAGLMPGAFAGVDYIGVSGDTGSTSALIPIFGVGLINATAKD
jgi:hypothetical protein